MCARESPLDFALWPLSLVVGGWVEGEGEREREREREGEREREHVVNHP